MTTIRIFTDITDKTLVELAKYLDSIEDGSEVTLQICSAGGFVFCAFGIIDYLKARHFKTTAEVLGMAASAAALIAISCDRVRMAEYASLMIHGAYGDGIDSSDPGIVRANELALEIIRKRDSKFTAQQLETDTWIGAQLAVKMGLADDILTNAQDIEALCKYYLAKLHNREMKVMDDEKKVCAEAVEEQPKEGEIKAEELSQDDVNEAILKRLEMIEHRLAVLEGEGKKEDDELEATPAEDEVMARRKALYAKLTTPAASMPKAQAKGPKKSKINLKNFLD